MTVNKLNGFLVKIPIAVSSKYMCIDDLNHRFRCLNSEIITLFCLIVNDPIPVCITFLMTQYIH